MAIRVVLVLVLLAGALCPTTEGSCRLFSRWYQKDIDLDTLMGDWYAVEIVEHDKPVEENTISTVIDVCPVLQLHREDDTIRLQWNENAGVLVYKFRQPKPHQPGFWDSAGSQNGSLVERYNVRFSGTVQVMKAVSSHMVLTFCARGHQKMFSVLMSRTKRLHHTDVRGVNNMLKRRGLPRGLVKEMCRGAAPAPRLAAAAASAAVLLVLLASRH
ncbi:uncharacterized protein [Periplaneta americana]|uniref:uncharacterized protein isoform X2 n=1 Tax=Periplaneta americana TaxID=6978 RepID=UPI0037E823E5